MPIIAPCCRRVKAVAEEPLQTIQSLDLQYLVIRRWIKDSKAVKVQALSCSPGLFLSLNAVFSGADVTCKESVLASER